MDRLDRDQEKEIQELETETGVEDISESAWQFTKYRIWSNLHGGKKKAAD